MLANGLYLSKVLKKWIVYFEKKNGKIGLETVSKGISAQIYSTSEKLEFEKEYYASQMLNFCTLAKIYESKLLAVGAEIPKLNQSCEYYILPDDKK